MPTPLRVLACAYAAHPTAGSESYVGWAGLRAIAKHHHVTAIIHGHNREDIERILPSLPERENLQFRFVGGPHSWHPNRLIARFQDWARLAKWTRQAANIAEELAGREKFDLAHHLTIATWRMPSPLAGLDIPLVWGPVGGGESFPPAFFPILSPVSRTFELLRIVGNQLTERSDRMKRFGAGVSMALGNNLETLAALERIGIAPNRLAYLSQSFLLPEKFLSREALDRKLSAPSNFEATPLRIFAGGNLEGRKGVSLVLEALARLGRNGTPFSFTFGGRGPELGHLERLAARLDFGSGTVSLGSYFSGSEYQSRLDEADVYLLPSLREGAPVTMIEAMARGAVPIVAGAGGAPMVVDENCGFVVPVNTPEAMISRIFQHLETLSRNPDRRRVLARAAWERAKERCMEDSYLEGIQRAYACALIHAQTAR